MDHRNRDAAKVKVDGKDGTEEFASAHDFRRAFGKSWAKVVPSQIVQRLMRNAKIETTLANLNSSHFCLILQLISSTPDRSRTIAVSPANSAFSESAGAQAGAIDFESDSQGQLRQEALDDLQRAWKSIRRMEDLSDDPRESKAAGKAVAFVDKAFAELEGRGE